jgi:hypothetical protein
MPAEFDPRTGEFHSAGNVAGGAAEQKFVSPLAGDAVLHLVTGTESGAGR